MRVGSHRISGIALLVAATPPLLAGVALIYLQTKCPSLVAAYQPVFAPVAGLISAVTAILAGLLFATFTIEANTKNAKVKTAYDSIAKKQWDKDFIAARETFLSLLRKKDVDISAYVSPEEHEYNEAKSYCEALRNIANDYELTAVGIKQHVLDEDLIKLYNRSAMIRDYNVLKPYILAVRKKTGNDKIFKEFEALAQKWVKEG